MFLQPRRQACPLNNVKIVIPAITLITEAVVGPHTKKTSGAVGIVPGLTLRVIHGFVRDSEKCVGL